MQSDTLFISPTINLLELYISTLPSAAGESTGIKTEELKLVNPRQSDSRD